MNAALICAANCVGTNRLFGTAIFYANAVANVRPIFGGLFQIAFCACAIIANVVPVLAHARHLKHGITVAARTRNRWHSTGATVLGRGRYRRLSGPGVPASRAMRPSRPAMSLWQAQSIGSCFSITYVFLYINPPFYVFFYMRSRGSAETKLRPSPYSCVAFPRPCFPLSRRRRRNPRVCCTCMFSVRKSGTRRSGIFLPDV